MVCHSNLISVESVANIVTNSIIQGQFYSRLWSKDESQSIQCLTRKFSVRNLDSYSEGGMVREEPPSPFLISCVDFELSCKHSM